MEKEVNETVNSLNLPPTSPLSAPNIHNRSFVYYIYIIYNILYIYIYILYILYIEQYMMLTLRSTTLHNTHIEAQYYGLNAYFEIR
jgi:hypothetical protein